VIDASPDPSSKLPFKVDESINTMGAAIALLVSPMQSKRLRIGVFTEKGPSEFTDGPLKE
jgi:hypothetical protein